MPGAPPVILLIRASLITPFLLDARRLTEKRRETIRPMPRNSIEQTFRNKKDLARKPTFRIGILGSSWSVACENKPSHDTDRQVYEPPADTQSL